MYRIGFCSSLEKETQLVEELLNCSSLFTEVNVVLSVFTAPFRLGYDIARKTKNRKNI